MKVAVLFDAPHWAQHQNAVGLQRFAPSWCTVDVFQLGKHGSLADYDVVYNLNLPSAGAGQVSCVASHAWMYPALDTNDWRTRGVNPCRNAITGARHLSQLKAAVCRNEALGEWASKHCSRVGVFPAGVDTSIFYPKPRAQNTKLRVGWCGQVHHDDRNGQVKGYWEVWLPLVEKLGERYEFEANTNTAGTAKSPQEMADWFRSLDVFVSTSSGDGTPNPPFQSAACGCAVISTDVGQVTDWKALRDSGATVPAYRNESDAAYTTDEVANRIAILESPSARRWATDRLIRSIKDIYDYRVLAPKILSFVCGVDA